MHIHKISNQKYIHFLKQERKDPITGDLIVEGDEVVFCAECKSAFLKSSWEYIGKRHCESNSTLSEFPTVESLSLKIQPSNNPYFVLKGSVKKNQKKLEKNLDNFWKKDKQFIRIDSIIQSGRFVKSEFSLEKSLFLNITLLFCLFLSVLLPNLISLNLLGLFATYSSALLFLIAPVIVYSFRPNLYLRKISNNYFINHPIIYFEENSIGVYFDNEKTNYKIDYKEISEVSFDYDLLNPLNSFQINILTSTMDEVSFKLYSYDNDENYFINNLRKIATIINQKASILLTFSPLASSSYKSSETIEEFINKYLANEKIISIEKTKIKQLS